MDRRRVLNLIVVTAIAGAAAVVTTPAAGAQAVRSQPIEVTNTARGAALIRDSAQRFVSRGIAADSAHLRAWRIRPGEFVVAQTLPPNLESSVTTDADGKAHVALRFDMTTASVPDGRLAAGAATT